MGEAKLKRKSTDLISVLIPERGRPEKLRRLIHSLIDAAGGDNHWEIIVQVDEDDPEWLTNEPSLPKHNPLMYGECDGIRVLFRPRPPTLGEKLNQLAEEAKGGLLWFIANDMEMKTHGWPQKFREAAAKLKNGYGIAYTRDPTHPNHSSYWMMTRTMYERVGNFAVPWFPYWFCDTWWNEIGILSGMRVEIDAEVGEQDGRGKTHGLVDLGFWCRFFEETRPMRVKDAMMLLSCANGTPQPPQADVAQINARIQMCAQQTAHLHTEAFQKRWGGNAESGPPPNYAQTKALAEKIRADLMAQQPRKPSVALAIPSGRSWEAGMGCAVTALSAYSAMAGVDVAVLNVQSSMITHGRNATVEIALRENCDYILWIDSDMKFPPDALVRLMKHQKDVVGATYNKRVPPFETLGKLVGPMPSVPVDGGLHEALLMPSGMLLVKSDVYRKVSYPWYAEGYVWAGETGIDKFWTMMKEYWGAQPPDAISASLRGTAFASWINDNFCLSEFGDPCVLLSEDLFFCRKARRNGIKLWMDLDLTFQMVHIGVSDITCQKPNGPVPATSSATPPGSAPLTLAGGALAAAPKAPETVSEARSEPAEQAA